MQRNRKEGLKIPSDFLPTLTRLTRLHLDAEPHVRHGRQQLGVLTSLKHLHLGGFNSTDLESLQPLQQLTSLSVWQIKLAAGWAGASGLSQLTGLQQLQGEDDVINLAALQSITWLRRLRLANVEVVKEPHQSGLFAWISQQHTLTHLEVLNVFDPARVLQTGGALSLGSHMHELRLHLWIDCGAWPQLFPVDKQLHSLTHLAFLAPAESEPCQCADLATVVQCCPRLRALSVDASDINITPLSRQQHARVLGGIGHLLSLQHLTTLLLAFCCDEDAPAGADDAAG